MARRDALRAIAGSLAAAIPFAGSGCTDRGSDGRTEASLWFAYGGKNREVLLALVDAFHSAQTRFRIVPTYQGDYFEALAKLRTALAARAAPALTHVVGEVVPYLAEAGVLASLAEVEAEGPLDLVPELAQAGTFVGGAARPLVALPFNRSTPVAYVNGKLFDELRLAPPATWDDLRAVAGAATRRQGGTTERFGFACPVDWWFWCALVGQAGGHVVDADGTPTLGGEAGVAALRFWRDLVHVDRSMKPPPGRDYNAWQAAHGDFLSGRAAMIWSSAAFLRYLEENAPFPVRAVALPKLVKHAVPVGGTLFVMPRGTIGGARDGALAFLRWMMQPAQANAWATRTGYVPVSRRGVAELERSGYYDAHPNDRVALAQLAHAEPWPWVPNLFRVQREAVQPRLEEAVLGERDPEGALAEARAAALEP